MVLFGVLLAGFVLLLNLLLWNRKETYIIYDGGRMILRTTAQESPVHILAEAGIQLNEGDVLDIFRTDEGPALQILRQQRITVDHCGETVEAASYGETVASLLQRLELTVGEGDRLSHSPEAETYDGMELRIYRLLEQEQTYTVTLPPEILYCCDPTLPLGTQRVLTQGKNGELLRTARVTYVNGQEASREVLHDEVLAQPVNGIMAIGTKQPEPEEAVPVIGNGLIRLPTGETLYYTDTMRARATAYTHTDAGCDTVTATGTTVRIGTVAVDPTVIPYGTRMFIVSNDGCYIYGVSVAEDCGGAIKGDRIDLYFPTTEECIQFGFRNCTIYFLG